MTLARIRPFRTVLLVACATTLSAWGTACTVLLGLRDDYVLASEGGAGGGDLDADPSDIDGGRDIQGSLTVHVPSLGPNGVANWVFIGAGKGLPPQTVLSDTVVFRDEALVGPQDVTLAQTYQLEEDTWVVATTLRRVARNDVWFGEPERTPEVTLTATGRVAGYDGGRPIAFVATHGFRVGERVPATTNGAWTNTIEGAASGNFRLIALEEPPDGGFFPDRRVGQSDVLTLSGFGVSEIAVGDVRLDRQFTESLDVILTSGESTAADDRHGELALLPARSPRPSLFEQRSEGGPSRTAAGRSPCGRR